MCSVRFNVPQSLSFYYDLATLGTTFDSTEVTAGTTYTYFIRATNAARSKDSNTITLTTKECALPREVIVDNPSPGFSRYGPPSYRNQASIGYNGHMFWTYNNQW